MKRQEFIKSAIIAALSTAVLPSFFSCKKEHEISDYKFENLNHTTFENLKVNQIGEISFKNFLVVEDFKVIDDSFLSKKYNCSKVIECKVIKIIKVKKRKSISKTVIVQSSPPRKDISHQVLKIRSGNLEYLISDFSEHPRSVKLPMIENNLSQGVNSVVNSKIISLRDLNNLLPIETVEFFKYKIEI